MALYDYITPEQQALIESAPMFFTASVHPDLADGPAGEGPVNVSPKGMTRLHVLTPESVAYLDYPGSGNETARHAQGGGPVTLMVMSMTATDAAIVRLYGRATVHDLEDTPLRQRLTADAPQPHQARQIVEVTVERTQTSCGYGVPVFDLVGERPRDGRGKRFKG